MQWLGQAVEKSAVANIVGIILMFIVFFFFILVIKIEAGFNEHQGALWALSVMPELVVIIG